jgi:hypothetical protein
VITDVASGLVKSFVNQGRQVGSEALLWHVKNSTKEMSKEATK